jgi:large subunit ribosomal protein L24
LQTTLLSLAIAVILALLAALIGPHFIDWNAHRATFEQQASQMLGLPVRVSGNMDVRLLPSPTLILGGVEIGRPGDANVLRAKGLGIEFALPPLLSGKFRAVEMKVVAPQLRLSLDRDGRASVPAALAGLNVEALSIDRLAIEDAQVELADEASGLTAVLGKLWFHGEVKALPGPLRGEGAFALNGGLYAYRIAVARPEAAGARVKLALDPSGLPLTVEAEGLLTAENGAPRFEGGVQLATRTAAKAGTQSWRLGARVKANANAALFEQVEYQYGPDERALKLTGTAEARFGAAPRLYAVLSARALDADKLMAEREGGPEGGSSSPRRALAQLLAAAAAWGAPPIPLQLGFGVDSLTLGGANVQNLRGDIEWRAGVVVLSAFEARAPGFTQIQASGQVTLEADAPAFAGPLDIGSVDPRAFVEWAEGRKESPPLPARPLKLRGDLTAGAGLIAVERLRAEIDRKTVEGSVSYAAADAPGGSRFAANLRADELDLDALAQIAGSFNGLAPAQRPDAVALTLSLGRLHVAGLDADRTDLQVSLDRSGLAIERLSVGDLAGIGLQGHGRIGLAAAEPQGSLAFDLDLREGAKPAALVERFAPSGLQFLKHAAEAAVPGRLRGYLGVEPGSAGASRLMLNADGRLGAASLQLTSLLEGDWRKPATAKLSLFGALEAADANALFRLAGLGGLIAVPAQAGTYSLSLDGRPDGELRLESRLTAPDLNARANGTVDALGSAARRAVLDVAVNRATGAAPLSLKTRASLDMQGARFDDIAAVVDGSGLHGRLGLRFGAPATVDGEVKADSLDLPALFALAGLGLTAAEGEGWSETPFPPSPLPDLRGTVRVDAVRASVAPQLQASDLRAELSFDGATVTARPVQAALSGGKASGDLTLRRGADGIGVKGRLSLSGAEAGPLLSSAAPAVLRGRADLDLELEGAGRSPRALIGSLNGSGRIAAPSLRVNGIDPKAIAAAVRAVDQGLPLDTARIREVVGKALDAGALTLQEASAMLSVAAGVVRIESFGARADGVDVALSGSYNMPQAALDLRLAVAGAASRDDAARPEFSVLLRGPATAPQKSLDVSSLTGWLALRSVDQQTRRLEAIQRGQAKDIAPDITPNLASDPAPRVEEERRVTLPEQAPAMPRRRPAPQPYPQVVAPAPQPSSPPRAQPLPPPIDIRPLPGERNRVPQPVESAPPWPVAPRPF